MIKFNFAVGAIVSALLVITMIVCVWDHDPDMHSWHGTIAEDHVFFVDGYSVGLGHIEYIVILVLGWWTILTLVSATLLGFFGKILAFKKEKLNALDISD